MGFEATTRRTSLSFLYSLPAFLLCIPSVGYLGPGSLSWFLVAQMLFLKENKPLQQHNLGQVSGSLERNLNALLNI